MSVSRCFSSLYAFCWDQFPHHSDQMLSDDHIHIGSYGKIVVGFRVVKDLQSDCQGHLHAVYIPYDLVYKAFPFHHFAVDKPDLSDRKLSCLRARSIGNTQETFARFYNLKSAM